MGGTDKNAHGGRGHETRDINLRGAWILVAGIAIAVPLVMFGMVKLFGALSAREARLQAPPVSLVPGEANPAPPEPRLQEDPIAELKRYRAEQAALAGSYGWADRSAGRVRIPVERAMELLAQRGLPARRAGAGTDAPGEEAR